MDNSAGEILGKGLAEEICINLEHGKVLNKIFPYLDNDNKRYVWVRYRIMRNLSGEPEKDVLSDSLCRAITLGFNSSSMKDYPKLALVPEIFDGLKQESFGDYIMCCGLMLCEKPKIEEPAEEPEPEPTPSLKGSFMRKLRDKLRKLARLRLRVVDTWYED